MSKAQVEVKTPIKRLSFWLSKRKTSKQEYMYLNSKKATKKNNVIKKHTK